MTGVVSLVICVSFADILLSLYSFFWYIRKIWGSPRLQHYTHALFIGVIHYISSSSSPCLIVLVACWRSTHSRTHDLSLSSPCGERRAAWAARNVWGLWVGLHVLRSGASFWLPPISLFQISCWYKLMLGGKLIRFWSIGRICVTVDQGVLRRGPQQCICTLKALITDQILFSPSISTIFCTISVIVNQQFNSVRGYLAIASDRPTSSSILYIR